MRKISEYQDGDALDLLADLLEPAVEIIGDTKVQDAYKAGGKLRAISAAIKLHKGAVMEVMARMNDVPVKEYHCNFLTLPIMLLDLLNDDMLIGFFTEQVQMMTTSDASGPVTGNIEDAGK